MIKARTVLSMTLSALISSLPDQVDVVYDDGQVFPSSKKKLIYSWFIWEFHREYPVLPLLFGHHVDSELKGGLLSSNTHIDLIGKIQSELILEYGFKSVEHKENILKLIYQVTNNLYNEIPKFAERHVMTLDILDIIQLSTDQRISDMRDKLDARPGSMEDFYAESRKILLEDPRYVDNNLIQYIKMKILNNNQVNQCIFARGLPVEVTGVILKTPITSCYATGMYKLYDYVSESRGASKHLYAAETPLQQAEYFARRLQLAGMVVKGISTKDCGTTKYLEWFVKPPTFTSTGRQVYAGDLSFMEGKHYLDETTNTLKTITGQEKHLHGRLIKIRSALYCKEPDPYRICPTCFGLLHHNVSEYANLGHLCDATLTQQFTQTLLGTKHHIGSAIGTVMLLKEEAQRYLTFSYAHMSFMIRPLNKTSRYKLLVKRNSAIGLTDLKLLSNVENIKAKRITAISEIVIQEIRADGGIFEISVMIEQNKRFGYFSNEFLQYVKEKGWNTVGWNTTEFDYFSFDLDDWDTRLPIVRVPDMEYSYSNHVDMVANLIESKSKKLTGKIRPGRPDQLLVELFELVNSKISINLPLLEVIVYAVMTPSEEDFGLARHAENPIVNLAKNVVVNRSLAPAYAYEYQRDTIVNPRSFFKQNRPDSPIDVFLCPKEVVHHIHQKRLDP